MLTKGRRTALPRHQTLRAAMGWSYELLPETEQIILRRVAVFQGDFTIDAVLRLPPTIASAPPMFSKRSRTSRQNR